MPVTCPHCNTRYVLPQALLGPGGARVRCPRCREPFAVTASGEALAKVARLETADVAPMPAADSAPEAIGAPSIVHAPAASASMASAQPPAPVFAMPKLVIAEPTGGAGEIVSGAVMPGETEAHTPGAAPEIAVSRTTEPATPIEIARAVLDELSAHSGEAIAASHADGKLFREFGAVLAEAFEFYRRRLGSGADPAPFRAALKERWGVDLDPQQPTGRIL